MNGKGFLLLGLIFVFAGCGSDASLRKTPSYRDPLTYSFEAYTPHTEEDPLLQILTKTKETARQIREWEKKHLW